MAEARPELKAVEVLTRPSDVLFTRRNVQPPSVVYVAAEDQLFVSAQNRLAGIRLSIRARMLTPQGKLQTYLYDFFPTSDRLGGVFVRPLAEGFLLSLLAETFAVLATHGDIFVTAGLLRGGVSASNDHAILLQDYVEEPNGICWPANPLRHSLDGPGAMLSVVGTDPAAGAEISETVPTGANWTLHSMRFSLATSAAVATRVPRIVIDDGGNIFYEFADDSGQVASTTETYVVAPFGFSRAVLVSQHTDPIPPGMRLRAGWRIRTVTDSLQAGDNYTAPVMQLVEHLGR